MPHVVHVSPRVQAGGGIESLHAYHRALPLPQTFVAFFDRQPEPRPDYLNLNVTWRTPLRLIRRRFRAVMSAHAGALVVYHNAWGFGLLGDVDHASRRAVFFHADPAYHLPDLPRLAGMIDGAAALAPSMVDVCAASPLGLSAARIVALRAPIEPPAPGVRERPRGTPLVLGYAGRIERAQKRCDLMPEFLRALRGTGMEFRFEVLGDGALRPRLERELAGAARFHGWVSRPTYWEILSGWDGVVFFSEHEAGPIGLLEGMSVGALPFCPWMGGSWADVYAPKVAPECHYPPGDMAGLAQRVSRLFGLSDAELAHLRARARSLVADHRGTAYESACAALLQTIAAEPRISGTFRRRPRLTDFLPLGLVTRLAPGLLR